MIFAVKVVMSVATLLYAIGYTLRRRNNLWHRRVMLLGFLATLAIAVVLVVGVQVYGSGYHPAFWLVDALGTERRAAIVLLVHRGVATVTLLLLIAQVVSGWRRLPLHRRLYPFTIGFWLIAFVSGMFIFA